MLDDIFSGLDADTEGRIFLRLFSQEGLFRKLGTTILLVTHAVHRLAYADHIIALTANGSIAEQGTFERLKSNEGYVAMLEAQYSAENTDESQTNSKKSSLVVDMMAVEEEKEHVDHHPDRAADDELQIAQKDLARQSGDLALYGYYLGSVDWWSSALWATCYILCGVASKISELVVNIWTEATDKEGNSTDGFYLGLYGLCSFITIVCLTAGAYHYILYFAPKSAINLHRRLLNSVMNAPLSFFTSVDIGTTTNRSVLPCHFLTVFF
jgi:ABC-type multidrug transport system fused ATPase/permease subunit